MKRALLTLLGALLPSLTLAAVPEPPPFDGWLAELRSDARSQGISAEVLDVALADLSPNPRVVELDRRQPEFVQTTAEYLDARVTPVRSAQAAACAVEHVAALQTVHGRSGVDTEALVAIWGMESAYGQYTGNFSVLRSVATLAWDRRRPEFFRRETLAALTILEQGHVTPDGLLGGWAGAMGQPQFMPSTFLNYAADYDGDGRADIWTSPEDTFASIARYLQQHGWRSGERWGWAVQLPAEFDTGAEALQRDADATCRAFRQHSATLDMGTWRSLGVVGRDGAQLPEDGRAALILPGRDSLDSQRSWLVTDNFAAVLRYNCANKYALAVGQLMDAAGRAPEAGDSCPNPPGGAQP